MPRRLELDVAFRQLKTLSFEVWECRVDSLEACVGLQSIVSSRSDPRASGGLYRFGFGLRVRGLIGFRYSTPKPYTLAPTLNAKPQKFSTTSCSLEALNDCVSESVFCCIGSHCKLLNSTPVLLSGSGFRVLGFRV